MKNNLNNPSNPNNSNNLNKNINILVIGGSGFIGTQLVQQLLNKGFSVKIADKQKSNIFPDLYQPCDICNIDDITRVCAGIDVIYHLVAEHRDDIKPISLYYEINVEGTRNICQVAKSLNIHNIIFTSTVAVYGLNSYNATENDHATPFNHYGRSKLEAENVLKAWLDSYPTNTLTIIRPTVVFGEGNRGNVYNLIRQIISRKFFMIGKGLNKKSMAYVENVAAFLVHALTFPTGLNLYNYVDKPDFDSRTLVQTICQCLKRKNTSRFYIPYFIGISIGKIFDFLSILSHRSFPISSVRIKKFTSNSVFSADKAKSTGFVSPRSLEEALKNTVEYEVRGSE